jgi:hypothetical protein
MMDKMHPDHMVLFYLSKRGLYNFYIEILCNLMHINFDFLSTIGGLFLLQRIDSLTQAV